MASFKNTAGVVQFNLRIPQEWLADADEIGEGLTRPGLEVTRTDAMRMALALGLKTMLAEVRTVKKGKKA